MKYVFILGSNYKDCKAKSESIIGEKDTKYAFVTKTKHLQGIPAEKMLEADNARANPEYAKIKRLFNKELKMRKAPTVPNFRKTVDAAIEHLQPKSIPEEFKEELDALIEKDEDVLEDVTWGVPDVQISGEEENVSELVDELPPKEPTVDEPVEVEEEPAPMIDELPEEEPDMEEDNDPHDLSVHSEITPEPEEEIEVEGLDVLEEREMEDDKADEDLPESASEEEGAEIKPVNPPRGWHLRNEFIDEVGNVFHKGEYVGKYDE